MSKIFTIKDLISIIIGNLSYNNSIEKLTLNITFKISPLCLYHLKLLKDSNK